MAGGAGRLEVPAHGRMERLLRQTGVPAGLLCNGRVFRLVSAPRGESSGWLDLHVADMVATAGRQIVAALRLLLSQTRLLSLPRDKRFAALLADSRRFQNEVSERLAEQVLHALYELLRGVQAADDASHSELLREPLAERPDDVSHALLTVILRLVFLLYAEERDLLPEGETFARHYSLAGLYERLREDVALHPDTMNQRYGAWAQLLVLFRLFHDGAEADGLHLPSRHGDLFNPDRFPFLEGRRAGGARQLHERIEPPLVPDGTVYRLLDKDAAGTVLLNRTADGFSAAARLGGVGFHGPGTICTATSGTVTCWRASRRSGSMCPCSTTRPTKAGDADAVERLVGAADGRGDNGDDRESESAGASAAGAVRADVGGGCRRACGGAVAGAAEAGLRGPFRGGGSCG